MRTVEQQDDFPSPVCLGVPVFVYKGAELPWSSICLESAAFAGQESRQVGRYFFPKFPVALYAFSQVWR